MDTNIAWSGFRVEHGVRPEHRALAARGYWQAFARKLRYPLGPEARALAFLDRVIDPRHAISAISDEGQLLGVAGFKDPDGAFVGGGLRDLAAIYGWGRALTRFPLLALLERECAPGTLLMDGIFVEPPARGRGIGRALLQAIERHAVGRGLRRVRLDVVDTNPRARALYEREGFHPQSEVGIGVLSRMFGFSRVTTMIRPVGGKA